MSSREIADLVDSRHDKVKQSIERLVERGVIVQPPMGDGQFRDALGRPRAESVYQVCKRDSFVVVAQLSPEFTAALVDRWQELEGAANKPRELSRMDLIQLAFEAEQQRLQLVIQVEAQASKIHSMENLFKEGMTHTQFCKGLNGVNVMQVGKFLEGRNWLFNESKSGLRFRVASYARDKYMTEHQHEVTPHGKEPFVSFTPVLLKKGAVRLYDLYLAGALPMKKNWNGLFTHDKALKRAA
jgi:phage regulator Rha-like protein